MGRLSSLLIADFRCFSSLLFINRARKEKWCASVKDYQEDPQEVHESVKQTAKDVSRQAVSDPTKPKKKLVLEKLRQVLF